MATLCSRQSLKQPQRLSKLNPFDHLPPELSQQIFSLACLDGGPTGRALSLVSRSISDISKPFKLQSLSVHNLKQAEYLASILMTTSPEDRRVLHLFISVDYDALCMDAIRDDAETETRMNASLSPFRRFTQTFSGHNRGNRMTCGQAHRTLVKNGIPVSPKIQDTMSSALIHILTAVSSNLQTLTIVSQNGDVISFVGAPSLCSLQALSISFEYDFPFDGPPYILQSFPPMPMLRQLDIGKFALRYSHMDLLCQIRRLAPGLTQVQLPSNFRGWQIWPTVIHDHQLLPSTVQQIFIRIHLRSPHQKISSREHYRAQLEEYWLKYGRDERIILMMPKKRDQMLGEAQRRWVEKIGGASWWGGDYVIDDDAGW